jgi:hypothetical protein
MSPPSAERRAAPRARGRCPGCPRLNLRGYRFYARLEYPPISLAALQASGTPWSAWWWAPTRAAVRGRLHALAREVAEEGAHRVAADGRAERARGARDLRARRAPPLGQRVLAVVRASSAVACPPSGGGRTPRSRTRVGKRCGRGEAVTAGAPWACERSSRTSMDSDLASKVSAVVRWNAPPPHFCTPPRRSAQRCVTIHTHSLRASHGHRHIRCERCAYPQ